jgi:hypothetical protein
MNPVYTLTPTLILFSSLSQCLLRILIPSGFLTNFCIRFLFLSSLWSDYFMTTTTYEKITCNMLIYNEFIDTEGKSLRFTDVREWMNFCSWCGVLKHSYTHWDFIKTKESLTGMFNSGPTRCTLYSLFLSWHRELYMFRVLFAPIIRSTTAAYSHRFCMVWCVIALEQVLVWDSFTVKHGQLQTTSSWTLNIYVTKMYGANNHLPPEGGYRHHEYFPLPYESCCCRVYFSFIFWGQ